MFSHDTASKIPTEDPAQALAFCKALVQLVTTMTLPVPDPVDLSVVIPVYNEQENLPILYQRLINSIEQLHISFEIIFVDDGSSDKSIPIIHDLKSRDSRVRLLELARNFGHQAALTAGIDHARGNAVVLMDSDLQDPPEALPSLIARWKDGFEVVYALRVKRKENFLKRFAYAAFYRILRIIADIRIPLDTGDFCIMDRRVVEQLKAMPERSRFLRGIRTWVGFRQTGLEIERSAREGGKPKYTIDRLISLALDGLISFSVKPLRFISICGIIISLGSFVLASLYLIQKVTVGLNPPGFATIVVLLGLLSGIQLMTIGLIGEYVGRIFEESKRRPLYILRNSPPFR